MSCLAISLLACPVPPQHLLLQPEPAPNLALLPHDPTKEYFERMELPVGDTPDFMKR